MPPEFDTYWKAAMEKPRNFSAWTKLVAYAETEKNLAACKKAYDEFLRHFPLSHIYWKKYVDIEHHLGNEEETEEVFKRGLKCNPLNVSMWLYYIQYLMKSLNMALPKCVDKLRGEFQAAVKACGMEFHSDELWKTYIEFETKQNNLKEVTSLYDRVLTIPTQLYETHYERFKVFAANNSPTDILNAEEQDWIRSRIQIENDNDQIASEDIDDCVEPLTDSDKAKFREQILRIREQLFIFNKAEVEKRQTFEEGIKRLYFFVAPLNVKQLQNWRRYLEFELSQGQHERIVFLYERCLMTCAFYEEFWLSYAQYIEGHSVEAARSVFERACCIHLPLKHSLHLQWAAFEEKHGCLDSARSILCRLENVVPGLAIVRLRRVGLERRNGNLQEAERLLKEAVQISAGTKLAGFYAMKLSRLILKLRNDPYKAKAVLAEALKKEPDNPQLHMYMIEFEISRDDSKDSCLICMEQALKSKLLDDTKRILCERRLEFLEDFGSSLTSWMDAYNEHQTYLKRKGDEGINVKDDKKVKSDSISEDCYPPGVPLPENMKSQAPPKDVSTEKKSAPENNASTANYSVKSKSESLPLNKTSETTTAQYRRTSEAYPSTRYYEQAPPWPQTQPYFPPQSSYCPPQSAPQQQFFRNYFPPPRENMFPNFPPQGIFNGPPGPPLFMDNSGPPFGMPPMFGYGPWFQNFGAQAWNRFFPPQ